VSDYRHGEDEHVDWKLASSSHHWSGGAIDLPALADDERRMGQLAGYAWLAERVAGTSPQVMVTTPYFTSYRLDEQPDPVPRVLWGGAGLWRWLLGVEVAQVGSEWDVEEARRDAERAAYRRKLEELRWCQSVNHVHIGITDMGDAANELWRENERGGA
jgi:hypothetical protein